MDRDFLLDLFSGFGAVTLRRMFSGYGVSRDGTNFALVLRGAVYLRADERSIPQFEAEGAKPFQYTARGKTVTLGSYWQLPERLYDDPDELAGWARSAFEAARQAAVLKSAKKSRQPKARGKKTEKVATPRRRSKGQAT
ncbi:MAG: TfoX/Sxy family protein [Rhizobiales bacterium]|nr:TfoX/Sxy family protein [Hyphomicrobiales bacterium]